MEGKKVTFDIPGVFKPTIIQDPEDSQFSGSDSVGKDCALAIFLEDRLDHMKKTVAPLTKLNHLEKKMAVLDAKYTKIN